MHLKLCSELLYGRLIPRRADEIARLLWVCREIVEAAGAAALALAERFFLDISERADGGCRGPGSI